MNYLLYRISLNARDFTDNQSHWEIKIRNLSISQRQENFERIPNIEMTREIMYLYEYCIFAVQTD